MNICITCGALTPSAGSHCPECFGTLIPYTEPDCHCAQIELDNIRYYHSASADLNRLVGQAERKIKEGKSILKQGHTESAANCFRVALEGTIRAKLLAAGIDDYLVQTWHVVSKGMNRKVSDVRVTSADQIEFMLACSLITAEEKAEYDTVRTIGNKGSHLEGKVRKDEAQQAQAIASKLFETLKLDISELSFSSDSAVWKGYLRSRAAALNLCAEGMEGKIDFLRSKNVETGAFIERTGNRIDWARSHSQWDEVRTQQRKLEEAQAQYRSRSAEIESRQTESALARAEAERMCSVYDPEEYRRILSARAAKKRELEAAEAYSQHGSKFTRSKWIIALLIVGGLIVFASRYLAAFGS